MYKCEGISNIIFQIQYVSKLINSKPNCNFEKYVSINLLFFYFAFFY